MRLKLYYILIMAGLLFGCSQPKSSTETADSTLFPVDTVKTEAINSSETSPQVEIPEEIEPPIDTAALALHSFGIYPSTVTDDKREIRAVNSLTALIKQFENEKYVIISMSYSHPDPVVMGTIKEAETWYFNGERKLCALTSEFKSERTTMSTIHLLENDNLLGFYSSSDFQDEGASASNSTALVSSLCPRCGVGLSNDDGSGYVVSVLDDSDVSKYGNEVLTRYEEMRKNLKGAPQGLPNGKDVSVYVGVDSDTINYALDSSLVHKFLRKY